MPLLPITTSICIGSHFCRKDFYFKNTSFVVMNFVLVHCLIVKYVGPNYRSFVDAVATDILLCAQTHQVCRDIWLQHPRKTHAHRQVLM